VGHEKLYAVYGDFTMSAKSKNYTTHGLHFIECKTSCLLMKCTVLDIAVLCLGVVSSLDSLCLFKDSSSSTCVSLITFPLHWISAVVIIMYICKCMYAFTYACICVPLHLPTIDCKNKPEEFSSKWHSLHFRVIEKDVS